jgi:hypothetical protein
MKRPVSVVASLVLALGTLSACGAAAGKPQVTEVCGTKMGSDTKCTCFADALEKGLTPEEFASVAKGIEDNKDFAGLLPTNLSDNPKISGVVAEASQSCFN